MKSSNDWAADIAWMDSDKGSQFAEGSNIVPLKKEADTRHARRPVTRVWDEAEVATRALEAFKLERAADSAYQMAIIAAEEFKEQNGLDRVDHKDEAFREFTAKEWSAYLVAKDEARKAKDRLKTACRNCLYGAPKRERINPKDVEVWKVLYAQIREGTICMKDALAVRDSKGDAFVKSREAFMALQAPDGDSDSIPF
jgi:hypothetical protein